MEKTIRIEQLGSTGIDLHSITGWFIILISHVCKTRCSHHIVLEKHASGLSIFGNCLMRQILYRIGVLIATVR